MEALILAIGVKACCIGSATIGGAANWAVNRTIKWIMMHYALDVTWGPALSFIIGFSAIRLLPVIEARIRKLIEKS